MKRDKDTLVESYASMAPEALDHLRPEERHQVYRMLRLRVLVYIDGLLEVSGAFADSLNVSNLETGYRCRSLKTPRLSLSKGVCAGGTTCC